MNIVSVKQLPGQQDYLLKEDDETVLKLRYNKDLHTARVETEKERRKQRNARKDCKRKPKN